MKSNNSDFDSFFDKWFETRRVLIEKDDQIIKDLDVITSVYISEREKQWAQQYG